MKTFAAYTLGCKLNNFETDQLISRLKKKFRQVPLSEEADIYLVNTCTVTSKSEQKARRVIRHLARENPNASIVVTGCYSELEPESIQSLAPNIITLSLNEKGKFIELINHFTSVEELHIKLQSKEEGEKELKPFFSQTERLPSYQRAMLKIQDGCDSSCSYCRITVARGESRSLALSEAVEQAKRFEQLGYREIVLTGVAIDQYQWRDALLPQLIETLLDSTVSVRFRLSSINPKAVTSELLTVCRNRRVCPHFHISAQSGSNVILKKMERGYRAEEIESAVSQLRTIKRDPFIGADFIVGFPGESEEFYRETLNLIERLELSSAHLFPFSSRPGTEAAKMALKVKESVIKERCATLKRVVGKHTDNYLKQCLKGSFNLLVESKKGEGGSRWQGTTENYLSGTISLKEEEPQGNIYLVKLTSIDNGNLFELI